MIFGIGCDICSVEKFRLEMEKEDSISIIREVFTTTEIAYCLSKRYPARHFAARFAAKEAFFKALGIGVPTPAYFRLVEIVHNQSKAPQIVVADEIAKKYLNSGKSKVFVSISHTSDSALAFVIIENNKYQINNHINSFAIIGLN